MHRAKIRRTATMGIVLATAFLTPALSRAAAVTREALDAFDRYIQVREARTRQEIAAGNNFLWIDIQPARQREKSYFALKHGEVLVQPTQDCESPTCPQPTGSLIHDWTAVAFIPGVTLAQTLNALQDYDRAAEYYSPQVARSRLLSKTGDDFRVFLRLKQKHVITVIFDTEYEIHYQAIDPTHAASFSHSTRVAEIEVAGTSQEHALTPDQDHGFLWRLNSYWRFYQADGGVYIQCNAISLTRDVPAALGWMIGRFIENISRESLTFTLTSTRQTILDKFNRAARNRFAEQPRKP